MPVKFIWYCLNPRCKRPYRIEPECYRQGAEWCRCKTPKVQMHPTRVVSGPEAASRVAELLNE